MSIPQISIGRYFWDTVKCIIIHGRITPPGLPPLNRRRYHYLQELNSNSSNFFNILKEKNISNNLILVRKNVMLKAKN